jgi:predicted nucleic acid-binding protein
LLRLAETPAVYRPIWSETILEEVARTQVEKLTRPFSLTEAAYWRREVTRAFPEAKVVSDETLVGRMANHPKDRHVLAAAVVARASDIVTFNLRDFPTESTAPWGVRAIKPDDFLRELDLRHPGVVAGRIRLMAEGWSLSRTLSTLHRHIPITVARIRADLELR